MNTKRTLTTLSVAAAMALGGIAVAQTAGGSGENTNDMSQSSSTMQNSGSPTGTSDLSGTAASSDTSVLGNSGSTASSDTSVLGNAGTNSGTGLSSSTNSTDTSTLGASSDTSLSTGSGSGSERAAQVDRG